MNQRISLHIEFTLDMNRAELIASYGPNWDHWWGKKKLFSTKTRFIENLNLL